MTFDLSSRFPVNSRKVLRRSKRTMTSSSSEDLTCSICLTLFDDPVIICCGHSFCRKCITLSLSSQRQCPQCRAAVPRGGRPFITNHILKNVSEKAKESGRESGNVKESVCSKFCVICNWEKVIDVSI
uniref:RING-type domain-containing protein n=1 Tax=Kryptolebias marmoratus TaxID=37003 RepID=A0A3Q3B363_KRYMA